MPYITSVERLGIEQGIEQGMQRGEATLVLRQLNREHLTFVISRNA